MKKATLVLGVWIIASGSYAFTTQQFSNADANQVLRGFEIVSTQDDGSRGISSQKASTNELKVKRAQTFSDITRQNISFYYQYFHGIRVLDGEISIHESQNADTASRGLPEKRVVGKLLKDIKIDPRSLDNLNTPENLAGALAEAKAHFLKTQHGATWDFHKESDQANLVLKNQDGKLKPLYETRFYAFAEHQMPVYYHALIDPNQNNKVVKAWNDVMNHTDSGCGGNDKTGKYCYGTNGIPPLEVNKTFFGRCQLLDKSNNLRVVNMDKKALVTEWYPFSLLNLFYKTPFKYTCDNEQRDGPYYGAYSAADDAYFMGHVVQNVYEKWYATKVLGDQKVVLRVHFSLFKNESLENAFWDPISRTMNFGDGSPDYSQDGFYPLVSLDVTGHEMSHGFTNDNSNLQYHDESGALNEAFSDMAGVAAVAYLKQEVPSLYTAIYHTSDMSWGIGSPVMRNPDPKQALRYVNTPSRDGHSADCYKKIPGADKCLISYEDVVNFAYSDFFSPDTPEQVRQSVIVHYGSGVFNKFFYTLSTTPGWDIKKAFGLMLVCNRDGYWSENTDFQSAACSTLLAANELGYDTKAINNAFKKVGIDTKSCAIK